MVAAASLGVVAAAPRPVVAQAVAQQEFNIPALPLIDALALFGQQSGMQVTVDAALVRNVTARRVSGRMPASAALQTMLQGTGFVPRFVGAGTVTLQPAPVVEGTADMLPPVSVDAAGYRGQPWQSPPGYVATRSTAGSKTDTLRLENPQTTSVVTRDRMDAQAAQRDRDVLRYVPGIYADPYGNEQRYDSYFIRGFDGYMSAYRDGLRASRGVWTSLRTESYGLERIDVLKGPSSVLYGQNTPGGVIDRITKRPPADPLREVQLQAGSYDRFQGAFDVGGPIDAEGKYLYRLTAMRRDADTQFKYDDRRVPDDRAYVAPAFTWRPNSDTSLTVLADYLYNKSASNFTTTLVSPGLPPRPTRTLFGEPDFNKYEYEQLSLGYVFEHRFNEMWQVRQNLRYGRQDFDYHNIGGTLAADGRTINRSASAIHEVLNGVAVDTQVQLNANTGGLAHTVLFGVDHQRSTFNSDSRVGTVGPIDLLNPVYGQSVTLGPVVATGYQAAEQSGLYLQDQIRFGKHWVLTAGLRQDWAESVTTNRAVATGAQSQARLKDSAFTWRTGLTYVFDNGLAPYASYSESFLPTSGTDTNGSPFKPTTGEQYEIGLKYQPTGFESFMTVSLFDLTQQNVTTPDPAKPGTSARVQTGEIRSRGLELEVTARITPQFNVIAGYALLDMEITKSNNAVELGQSPTGIPKNMLSVWGDYGFASGPLAGFGVGAGVRYTGSTYYNAQNTLSNPSTTLVDAMIRYDLGRVSSRLEGAQIALNATNLFDKDYATCYSTATCVWAQSRTVIGTLKYRW